MGSFQYPVETHLDKGSKIMPGGKGKCCLSSQDKFTHRSFPRDQGNTTETARMDRLSTL